MPQPTFERSYTTPYGVLESVAPGLRRITAPNPGAFTFRGTGTYVIGEGSVAVIDPGPAIPEHIEALLAALGGENITHILVTHTHNDHSPGCRLLQQKISAPTYALGPHGMGRQRQNLTADEGGDLEFMPDVTLTDGQLIEGDGWQLECLHTPGHTSNHACYAEPSQRRLYSGDHVMGWSTSIVSPPDGDMGDYLRSLRRLLARTDDVYWPAHGGPIVQTRGFVQALVRHREARERQVLHCLQQRPQTMREMLPTIYADVDRALYPAAERSLLATLIYLVDELRVEVEGELSVNVVYRVGSS